MFFYRNRLIVGLIGCILCLSSLAGQSRWENYTRGTVVSSIAADEENIWIGTDGGIVKLNKHSGKRNFMNHANSGIPDNQINDIEIDDNGNIWFACGGITSSGGGLAKFDGEFWENFNSKNSDLPSNKISAIAFSSDKHTWIGSDRGLIQIQRNHQMIIYNTQNSQLPDDHILSISIDPEENIWVGTFNGMVRYDRKNSNWVVFATWNSPLPANEINCIAFEKDAAWIGTRAGLVKFDGVNWEIFDPSNSPLSDYLVNRIEIDDEGKKWIATDGGLVVFDDTEWTIYDKSSTPLLSNQIQSILIDDNGYKWNGYKWIGTSNNLIRFDGEDWKLFYTSGSGIPGNVVTSVASQSREILWAGTTGGLARYDGNFWTVFNTFNSGLPDNNITCIAIERIGSSQKPFSQDPGLFNIWLGTNYGLVSFNKKYWKTYNVSNSGLPDESVTSIAIDKNGKKWVGTANGLTKFDGSNWTSYSSKNSGLPDDFVTAVAVEEPGIVWIGTLKGLARFDGYDWQTFDVGDSKLPQNVITAIVIDSDNNKWIGCRNKVTQSLVKLNKDWTIYTTLNSDLPEKSVESLAYNSQDQKLWIGTWDGGLANYDGKNWQTFDVFNSGLSHNIINSISIDNSGNSWIATNWGLTKLNAAQTAQPFNIIEHSTGITHKSRQMAMQSRFPELSKNYPDPFNPTTNIEFILPQTEFVTLKVYNILGEEIDRLVSGKLNAGKYSYRWNASEFASGVYLYRLVVENHVEVRKMVLTK